MLVSAPQCCYSGHHIGQHSYQVEHQLQRSEAGKESLAENVENNSEEECESKGDENLVSELSPRVLCDQLPGLTNHSTHHPVLISKLSFINY